MHKACTVRPNTTSTTSPLQLQLLSAGAANPTSAAATTSSLPLPSSASPFRPPPRSIASALLLLWRRSGRVRLARRLPTRAGRTLAPRTPTSNTGRLHAMRSTRAGEGTIIVGILVEFGRERERCSGVWGGNGNGRDLSRAGVCAAVVRLQVVVAGLVRLRGAAALAASGGLRQCVPGVRLRQGSAHGIARNALSTPGHTT